MSELSWILRQPPNTLHIGIRSRNPKYYWTIFKSWLISHLLNKAYSDLTTKHYILLPSHHILTLETYYPVFFSSFYFILSKAFPTFSNTCCNSLTWNLDPPNRFLSILFTVKSPAHRTGPSSSRHKVSTCEWMIKTLALPEKCLGCCQLSYGTCVGSWPIW